MAQVGPTKTSTKKKLVGFFGNIVSPFIKYFKSFEKAVRENLDSFGNLMLTMPERVLAGFYNQTIKKKLTAINHIASLLAILYVICRQVNQASGAESLLFAILLAYAGRTLYSSRLRSVKIRARTFWLYVMTLSSAACIIAAIYSFLESAAKLGWLNSLDVWVRNNYFLLIPKSAVNGAPSSLDISVPNIALSLFLTSIAVVTWSSSGKQNKFSMYDFRAFYNISFQLFAIVAVFALTIYSWVIGLKYLSMIACIGLFAYTVTTSLFCYTAQSENATLRGIYNRLKHSLLRARSALNCRSDLCNCVIPYETSRGISSKDEKNWSHPRWLFQFANAFFNKTRKPNAARIKMECSAVRAAYQLDQKRSGVEQSISFKVDCPLVRAFLREYSDNAEVQWGAYKQDESPTHPERLANITHNIIRDIEAGWFEQPGFAFLTGFFTAPRSIEDKYYETYLKYQEFFLVELMHISAKSDATLNAICVLGCLFRLIQRESMSSFAENIQLHVHDSLDRVLSSGLKEIQLSSAFNYNFFFFLVIASCFPKEEDYLRRIILNLPEEALDGFEKWSHNDLKFNQIGNAHLLWELSYYCSFKVGSVEEYSGRYLRVQEMLKKLQTLRNGKTGLKAVKDLHLEEAADLKK